MSAICRKLLMPRSLEALFKAVGEGVRFKTVKNRENRRLLRASVSPNAIEEKLADTGMRAAQMPRFRRQHLRLSGPSARTQTQHPLFRRRQWIVVRLLEKPPCPQGQQQGGT